MSTEDKNQPMASAPTLDGDKIGVAEETTVPAQSINHGDVETTAEEPDKTYYSKLSVWLMVLFSGLAIGSDG